MSPRVLLPALLATTLCCSNLDVLVRKGPGVDIPGGTLLALAPSRLLLEVPGALREGPFEDNLTVGHVQLSGGYIVSDTEMGMQYRSKEVEIRATDAYAEQARTWLDETVRAVLADEGIRTVRIAALSPSGLPPPRRTEVRGSGPLDRRDNQNLPRFELTPQPLDAQMREALPDLQGATLLLVPMVVYYYSHNGGWFVGQTYGCAGGARVRVLWTLYDPQTGALLHWGDIEARHVDEYVSSPNSSQVDDYLIAVETELERQLGRHLFD